MKDIFLRQATLTDYNRFKELRDDSEKSIVYGWYEKYVYTGNKPTEDVQVIENLVNETNETIFKDYNENVKNTFFIMVDGQISGYITTNRKKGERQIIDIVIDDYSIINELYLSKIFYNLFEITKSRLISLYSYTQRLKRMLLRIGFFEKSGCLQKESYR